MGQACHVGGSMSIEIDLAKRILAGEVMTCLGAPERLALNEYVSSLQLLSVSFRTMLLDALDFLEFPPAITTGDKAHALSDFVKHARAALEEDGRAVSDLRKLDALIAEHVMGLGKPVLNKQHGWIIDEGDSIIIVSRYSFAIGAAWEVVEKLRTFGQNIEIKTRKDGTYWHVSVIDEKDPFKAHEIGAFENRWDIETMICLAALKAKGIDVSEWEKK